MLALMLVLAVQQTPAPMRSGEDVLRAMHDRYAGHWFTTLTFTQHNTATRPDGSVQHSTWKEYASLPGRLRIDFLPADSGNGAIYARDSQFTIQGHALKDATPFVHPLMVLGFDVY
ncbi:MAG TPA: hypothetical protein VFK78_02190, partial [Gemmatimonadales bacterium]|nr:hypothetical protein [Gemmatimonadales bacterium]